MLRLRHLALATSAALALGSGAALAQQTHTKVAQRDWNPVADEGRCQLRVWVDDTALLRLRGDDLWVETLNGERAYDTGSSCNQPLPLNRVRDFRVTWNRGRGAINEVQAPSRLNDFTGTIQVNDPQNGGALYLINLAWNNPGPAIAENRYNTTTTTTTYVVRDPLPAFDEVRACQERVRAEFLRRNTGGSYIEFANTPGRETLSLDRDRLYGEASARNRYMSRSVSYECILNERSQQIENIAYQYDSPTRGAMR